MHVSPYEKGNIFNREPRRPRRLLMHKREILRLFAKIKQDGYTLVPLSLYFKGPRVKVEIGLCKGKKLYDKREAAAKRDAKREMDRAMKCSAESRIDNPCILRMMKKGIDHYEQNPIVTIEMEDGGIIDGGALPRDGPQHGEQLHQPGRQGVL